MAAVHALIAEHERDDFQLYVAGTLPMTYRLSLGMIEDLGKLMPICLGLMGLVLGVLFRRVAGVVLPLLVVGLSLLSTLGIMVALEIPGSTAVQILPIFLLTVGVCDGVHILALAYRLRAEGATREQAIARSLGHSGLAVLMTSVTTAAGMASFTTAEMGAVVDLGILAPIGVMLAFAYTVTLLPALLAIFPLPEGQWARRGGSLPLEGFLVAAGDFATRAPWRVMLPTVLLCILLVLGALQLRFSHNGLSWFPEGRPDPRRLHPHRHRDARLGLGRRARRHPRAGRPLRAGDAGPDRAHHAGGTEPAGRAAVHRQDELDRRHRQGDTPGARRRPRGESSDSRDARRRGPGAAAVREQRQRRHGGARRLRVSEGPHQHAHSLRGWAALREAARRHRGAGREASRRSGRFSSSRA